MKLYFAPMEGITGLVCRNAYEACFSGSIDKYFAPFITATTQKAISIKELKDILPEKNHVPNLVPQILGNRADAFIRTAEQMHALGYSELNFNLGCPSKTVVTKRKGAGFLEFPHQVDDFLYEVCDWTQKKNIDVSIKTRLGMYEEEEFEEILDVYNKYPLCELILHPRLQTDYYKEPVREKAFAACIGKTEFPICYNGDLFDDGKLTVFREKYPQVDKVMIGRGLLMHPGLHKDLDTLWRFHDTVYEGYLREIKEDGNTLFKMKELWSYFMVNFDIEKRDVKKAMKILRKSTKRTDYESAISLLKMIR